MNRLCVMAVCGLGLVFAAPSTGQACCLLGWLFHHHQPAACCYRPPTCCPTTSGYAPSSCGAACGSACPTGGCGITAAPATSHVPVAGPIAVPQRIAATTKTVQPARPAATQSVTQAVDDRVTGVWEPVPASRDSGQILEAGHWVAAH